MNKIVFVTSQYPSDKDIAEHVTENFDASFVAMRISTNKFNTSYITNVLVMN